jgi:Zn-dependent metalloprotease
MNTCRVRFLVLALAVAALPAAALAQSTASARAKEALDRLERATGGAAVASTHRATGVARFIRLAPGSKASLGRAPARTAREKEQESAEFFRTYGAALGVDDPTALRLVSTTTDRIGQTHLTWKQFHGSVPVFAATVKTHFGASHRLQAVTGTAIPDVAVNEAPIWSSDDAAQVAHGAVAAERGGEGLGVGRSTLYVYRAGLAQGVPGANHLAWEIEVTNGAGIRELVYVDAHTGKIIDRVNGVHDDVDRRAYDGHDLEFAPPNYPFGAYWLEGQSFPTKSQEANNMITSSHEIYDVFANAFGYESFDGEGGTMDAIFNRGYDCPNASWNGTFISFCPGTTTDDVTAHEWGHAYTEYTHNLVYRAQPGALNESYSDIWGELVDLVNGRGTDAPGGARSAAACTMYTPPVGQLHVEAPAAIAGDYFAQSAGFGSTLTPTGTSGQIVAAIDEANAAGPTTFDACSTITNAAEVTGHIALVTRGSCDFSAKVYNAQLAGAIGVVIANNTATGLPGMGAGLNAELVTIPSLGVQQSTGDAIRSELTGGATVTAILRATPGTDDSYRWLMGEDSSAFNGAIRDMWNPACFSNPGKVSDSAYYVCSSANDSGGVHTNSGVPNHGFALLVDGGTYNGVTVTGIGLTKAAHLYFRAQDVYQVEDSDFADHADALEASCTDLTGVPLAPLTAGGPGATIVAGDCAQVSAAIAAVELRTPPTFCTPLLNPIAPPLCGAGTTGVEQGIASFDFESAPTTWTATHAGATRSFTPRDFTWVSSLPSGRAGSGFFGPDPDIGGCQRGDDESGVLYLASPAITLPAGAQLPRASFQHWVATEPLFDGGNLSVSVNGGAWQLVPAAAITFNKYNGTLTSAAAGNTNPLAGQPAWTGTDGGNFGGSWGRTDVNLGALAAPGASIRLRWNLGTDGCGGNVGWYLDDVNVYSCTPSSP